MGDEKEEETVDWDGDEKEESGDETEEETLVCDGDEKEDSGDENGDFLNLSGGVEPIFLEFRCDELLADFCTCPRVPKPFLCTKPCLTSCFFRV